MDTSTAARDLRQLLVAYDTTNRQIDLLNEHITCNSQRSMVAVMDGDRVHNLHLVLRTSVTEGVRHMYTQFQSRKWQQVQQKARNIASSIESDDSDTEQSSPSSTSSRSQERSVTTLDKASVLWSSAFCELYRDC